MTVTPTQDWTEYLAKTPLPPFTAADFIDARESDVVPFRREEWERLAQSHRADVLDAHIDNEHIGYLHPWCADCVIDEQDYIRDTQFPQTKVYTDADPAQQDYLEAEAIELLMARMRNYMVKHGGRLPEARASGDESYADLYLSRSELRNLPQPDPLIAGVLSRHSYGLLTGRDGTFKSFVALDWACHLATGTPWLGKWTEQANVLYIAGEGAYGIDARLDAWEDHHGVEIDDSVFTLRRAGLSLFKPNAELGHLLELIAEREIGLVVVDTLRRVTGSADGNSSEMGIVVDNLARIKEATQNGTVLVIAHTGKDDRDTRGFSGIEDDADFVWHTDREDQVVELRNTKMKDGPDGARHKMQAHQHLGSLILVEAGEELVVVSASQTQVLETMDRLFPQGVSGANLRDTCNLPKSTFYAALGDLVKAGHLVNTGTKQRPFYERESSGGLDSASSGPNAVQEGETASDLQESSESSAVQNGPVPSPASPAALKSGTLDGLPDKKRESA